MTRELTPSGRVNPCPVCGRDTDGDCRIGEEMVHCHYGSTFSPPSVAIGDVVTGVDGNQWAYTGDASGGNWAVFVPHDGRGRPGGGGLAGPRPPRRPGVTERQAFAWLEAAGQLKEGEFFRPLSNRPKTAKRDGKVKRLKPTVVSYSERWLAWSSSADPDDVAAAISTAEVIEEAIAAEERPWQEQVVEELKRAAPTGPCSLDQARKALQEALDRGASRADLAQLVAQLGRDSELGTAAIRGILQALEQEQSAADQLEVESARLAAAADRETVGRAYITLDSLFPPSLAAAIRTRVQHTPADDIAAAGCFLAGAAGVMKLGSEVVASRAADFRVPLNLYGSLVGRSGSKKGPVWKLLTCLPLRPIVADLARQAMSATERWKEENKGKKLFERTDPPVRVHLTTKEFTGEALDSQFQIQEQAGMGLMINRDELAGLFGGLNAYRGGRGSDSEQLLEAYDGSGSSSLRVGADGGGRFYQRCQLTIFGTIQPSVLQGLVANGDASGLWARFLFFPMPERVVPLPADELEEDAAAGESAGEYLASVIAALFRGARVSLALSAAARAWFMAYEARCQGDALRAPIAAQGAAWGKAPGKALRIAGLLHLLHQACRDGERNDLISEVTITRAANLVDHLTGWSLGLHEAAQGGEGTSETMRLIHRLAQSEGGPIQWRHVSQRLSKRQRAEIDPAVALAAVGALVRLGVGEQGSGGRRGAWTYLATKDLPG